MRFRVRGPNGQSAVTLPDDASVADVKTKLAEVTSIASFDTKYGYPPQPLDLDRVAPSAPISDLGIQLNGEQLIVSARAAAPAAEATAPSRPRPQPPAPASQSSSRHTTFAAQPAAAGAPRPAGAPLSLARKPKPDSDPPEVALPERGATLVLRVMPDDNSCLFRAFNTAYFGAGLDNMHELRSVVAQAIQADPATYSAVVLERPPDDYCRWIQRADAWGGQIELRILSEHFDVEICSVDVLSSRVDRYNQGRPQRVILVYSGIHYDVLALSPSEPPHTRATASPEFDEKVFSAVDDELLQKARELCQLLNSQGYHTDTSNFSLKCNVCQAGLKGEAGAIAHANETGHGDFSEA